MKALFIVSAALIICPLPILAQINLNSTVVTESELSFLTLTNAIRANPQALSSIMKWTITCTAQPGLKPVAWYRELTMALRRQSRIMKNAGCSSTCVDTPTTESEVDGKFFLTKGIVGCFNCEHSGHSLLKSVIENPKVCSIMFNQDFAMGVSIVSGFPAINYFSLLQASSEKPIISAAIATRGIFIAVPSNAPAGATMHAVIKGRPAAIVLTDRKGFFSASIPPGSLKTCAEYYFEMRSGAKVISRFPESTGMIYFGCARNGAVSFEFMPAVTLTSSTALPNDLTEREIAYHAIFNAARQDPDWFVSHMQSIDPLNNWTLPCDLKSIVPAKVWWSQKIFNGARKVSANINKNQCTTFCMKCGFGCYDAKGALDLSLTVFPELKDDWKGWAYAMWPYHDAQATMTGICFSRLDTSSMGFSSVYGFFSVFLATNSETLADKRRSAIVSGAAAYGVFMVTTQNIEVNVGVFALIEGKVPLQLASKQNGLFAASYAGQLQPCNKYYFEMRQNFMDGAIISRFPESGMIAFECSSGNSGILPSDMPISTPGHLIYPNHPLVTETQLTVFTLLNVARVAPAQFEQIMKEIDPQGGWVLNSKIEVKPLWWDSEEFLFARKHGIELARDFYEGSQALYLEFDQDLSIASYLYSEFESEMILVQLLADPEVSTRSGLTTTGGSNFPGTFALQAFSEKTVDTRKIALLSAVSTRGKFFVVGQNIPAGAKVFAISAINGARPVALVNTATFVFSDFTTATFFIGDSTNALRDCAKYRFDLTSTSGAILSKFPTNGWITHKCGLFSGVDPGNMPDFAANVDQSGGSSNENVTVRRSMKGSGGETHHVLSVRGSANKLIDLESDLDIALGTFQETSASQLTASIKGYQGVSLEKNDMVLLMDLPCKTNQAICTRRLSDNPILMLPTASGGYPVQLMSSFRWNEKFVGIFFEDIKDSDEGKMATTTVDYSIDFTNFKLFGDPEFNIGMFNSWRGPSDTTLKSRFIQFVKKAAAVTGALEEITPTVDMEFQGQAGPKPLFDKTFSKTCPVSKGTATFLASAYCSAQMNWNANLQLAVKIVGSVFPTVRVYEFYAFAKGSIEISAQIDLDAALSASFVSDLIPVGESLKLTPFRIPKLISIGPELSMFARFTVGADIFAQLQYKFTHKIDDIYFAVGFNFLKSEKLQMSGTSQTNLVDNSGPANALISLVPQSSVTVGKPVRQNTNRMTAGAAILGFIRVDLQPTMTLGISAFKDIVHGQIGMEADAALFLNAGADINAIAIANVSNPFAVRKNLTWVAKYFIGLDYELSMRPFAEFNVYTFDLKKENFKFMTFDTGRKQIFRKEFQREGGVANDTVAIDSRLQVPQANQALRKRSTATQKPLFRCLKPEDIDNETCKLPLKKRSPNTPVTGKECFTAQMIFASTFLIDGFGDAVGLSRTIKLIIDNFPTAKIRVLIDDMDFGSKGFEKFRERAESLGYLERIAVEQKNFDEPGDCQNLFDLNQAQDSISFIGPAYSRYFCPELKLDNWIKIYELQDDINSYGLNPAGRGMPIPLQSEFASILTGNFKSNDLGKLFNDGKQPLFIYMKDSDRIKWFVAEIIDMMGSSKIQTPLDIIVLGYNGRRKLPDELCYNLKNIQYFLYEAGRKTVSSPCPETGKRQINVHHFNIAIDQRDFTLGLQKSFVIAGVTGDQSYLEALALEKIPVRDNSVHKFEFDESLDKYYRKNLGEEAKILRLFHNIYTRDKQSFSRKPLSMDDISAILREQSQIVTKMRKTLDPVPRIKNAINEAIEKLQAQ